MIVCFACDLVAHGACADLDEDYHFARDEHGEEWWVCTQCFEEMDARGQQGKGLVRDRTKGRASCRRLLRRCERVRIRRGLRVLRCVHD